MSVPPEHIGTCGLVSINFVKDILTLISVWSWNIKAIFWVKNQWIQWKPLDFDNTGGTRSSKIRHYFR